MELPTEMVDKKNNNFASMKYITNTESEGIEDFPINSHQVIFNDPLTQHRNQKMYFKYAEKST